jgi:ubiquitin-conjugating enzyme E2 Q
MISSSQQKFIDYGSNPRRKNRIEKELKNIQNNTKYNFLDFQIIDENVWRVGMSVPENHNLYNTLSTYSSKFNIKPQLQFEITFPGSYPFEPPFIRIILPRFVNLQNFVTSGGSICMENITNSKSDAGYNPTMSIENLLIAIHSLILTKTDIHLDFNNGNPATWDEAVVGFMYTTKTDHWEPHKLFTS